MPKLRHSCIFFSYLIANVVMIVIFIILLQLPLKVIKIPVHRRVPVVLTFCVIGVVATNNRLEDGWVILCFGIFESLLANWSFHLLLLLSALFLDLLLKQGSDPLIWALPVISFLCLPDQSPLQLPLANSLVNFFKLTKNSKKFI